MAVLFISLGGAPPAGAAPSVEVHDAIARTGPLVAYRLENVRARGIRRARLSTGRRWQRLPLRRARRGARRGLLVVRARRALLRRAAPRLVLVAEVAPVSVTSAPHAGPAPEAAPAGPAAEGCTFGTFDVGNWPGACWRPYSPASPFNQRLPDNPRLVSDSAQIVQRITGFGPLQHITAGRAGTSLDFGDPVFWSRPTDPEYTIDCVEPWGTCDIEGHRLRIPSEALAAQGADGHMAVVDQATGWEYDFWTVKDKPPGGGTLTIGWGGRTRIDGLGLDSAGNAAGFGNLAGKLRVEELEAGRIDHALFLAIRCSNGGVVYPVVAGHAGQRCSQLGLPEENAPPMGTRVMLDMSAEEIDALAVPAWKRTILRAMAEYGAIMGDTGSSWAIAEESAASHISFGHEDRWERFARDHGVPYYAPDDVYVFNLQDGVDWPSRLKVVDPCVSQMTC